MEYEIESEFMLFDASTNPSIEPARERPVRERPAPPVPRRLQRAEAIPDEEEQAA